MNYTEQLERETERTRLELANTVEELRERLTPGQVLDEILDYAGSGDVGDYLRNLRRQAVDNPLPLGLMGVSVAWLVAASAFGSRRKGRWLRDTTGERVRGAEDFADAARPSSGAFARRAEAVGSRAYEQASGIAGQTAEQARHLAGRAADQAGDFASRTADRAGDFASRTADQASDFANRAADRAADIAGQASAAAARVGDRVRGVAADASANLASAGDSLAAGARAVGDSARGIGRNSRDAGRALVDFGREQPLIVAATGIVLGALIGALLPSTQIEDELIGESADAAKERLRAMAGEQYEKVKDAAMRTAEAAIDASGATEASSRADPSSHEERAETHASQEFGPGPGVHSDAEQTSGDHPNATEEAERTHADRA